MSLKAWLGSIPWSSADAFLEYSAKIVSPTTRSGISLGKLSHIISNSSGGSSHLLPLPVVLLARISALALPCALDPESLPFSFLEGTPTDFLLPPTSAIVVPSMVAPLLALILLSASTAWATGAAPPTPPKASLLATASRTRPPPLVVHIAATAGSLARVLAFSASHGPFINRKAWSAFVKGHIEASQQRDTQAVVVGGGAAHDDLSSSQTAQQPSSAQAAHPFPPSHAAEHAPAAALEPHPSSPETANAQRVTTDVDAVLQQTTASPPQEQALAEVLPASPSTDIYARPRTSSPARGDGSRPRRQRSPSPSRRSETTTRAEDVDTTPTVPLSVEVVRQLRARAERVRCMVMEGGGSGGSRSSVPPSRTSGGGGDGASGGGDGAWGGGDGPGIVLFSEDDDVGDGGGQETMIGSGRVGRMADDGARGGDREASGTGEGDVDVRNSRIESVGGTKVGTLGGGRGVGVARGAMKESVVSVVLAACFAAVEGGVWGGFVPTQVGGKAGQVERREGGGDGEGGAYTSGTVDEGQRVGDGDGDGGEGDQGSPPVETEAQHDGEQLTCGGDAEGEGAGGERGAEDAAQHRGGASSTTTVLSPLSNVADVAAAARAALLSGGGVAGEAVEGDGEEEGDGDGGEGAEEVGKPAGGEEGAISEAHDSGRRSSVDEHAEEEVEVVDPFAAVGGDGHWTVGAVGVRSMFAAEAAERERLYAEEDAAAGVLRTRSAAPLVRVSFSLQMFGSGGRVRLEVVVPFGCPMRELAEMVEQNAGCAASICFFRRSKPRGGGEGVVVNDLRAQHGRARVSAVRSSTSRPSSPILSVTHSFDTTRPPSGVAHSRPTSRERGVGGGAVVGAEVDVSSVGTKVAAPSNESAVGVVSPLGGGEGAGGGRRSRPGSRVRISSGLPTAAAATSEVGGSVSEAVGGGASVGGGGDGVAEGGDVAFHSPKEVASQARVSWDVSRDGVRSFHSTTGGEGGGASGGRGGRGRGGRQAPSPTRSFVGTSSSPGGAGAGVSAIPNSIAAATAAAAAAASAAAVAPHLSITERARALHQRRVLLSSARGSCLRGSAVVRYSPAATTASVVQNARHAAVHLNAEEGWCSLTAQSITAFWEGGEPFELKARESYPLLGNLSAGVPDRGAVRGGQRRLSPLTRKGKDGARGGLYQSGGLDAASTGSQSASPRSSHMGGGGGDADASVGSGVGIGLTGGPRSVPPTLPTVESIPTSLSPAKRKALLNDLLAQYNRASGAPPPRRTPYDQATIDRLYSDGLRVYKDRVEATNEAVAAALHPPLVSGKDVVPLSAAAVEALIDAPLRERAYRDRVAEELQKRAMDAKGVTISKRQAAECVARLTDVSGGVVARGAGGGVGEW